jgi:transposase
VGPVIEQEQVDVWLGIDVGKSEHFHTTLNDDGEQLAAGAVGNDESAIRAVIRAGKELGRPGVVIDQPGSIAALVLAVAREEGVPVAYIPGLVMRRAAQLYPGAAKTDPRESFVLADTARTHRRRVHWLADSDDLLAQLRVLVGFDNDLAVDVNRTTNRLRDALTSVAPGLERVLGDRLDHPAARAVLARWPTPTALRAAGPALRRLCRKQAPRAGDRLADELVVALAAQTVTVPAETTLGRVIAELADELERLYSRRARLAGEIEEVFLAHPFAQLLISMPGIGTKTGATILTEIGDGTAFPTAGHLAAYAGISPVTRQSGTSLRDETRARHGNHRLKNALFLAAFCSLRSPDSKAYYARKRAEGKRHNAAIMCLARRRCDVLHAILRTGAPYNPNHPGKPRDTTTTP